MKVKIKKLKQNKLNFFRDESQEKVIASHFLGQIYKTLTKAFKYFQNIKKPN